MADEEFDPAAVPKTDLEKKEDEIQAEAGEPQAPPMPEAEGGELPEPAAAMGADTPTAEGDQPPGQADAQQPEMDIEAELLKLETDESEMEDADEAMAEDEIDIEAELKNLELGEGEDEETALDDIVRGAKHTFAPHLLTKEDLEAPREWQNTLTEVGSSIVMDIASYGVTASIAAAGAAAVGVAAAPVVFATAAGWALYRGFGFEQAKANAEKRKFDPALGMMNVVTELNPLVRKTKHMAKASTAMGVQFGTQFAAEGARTYAYTGDTTSAIVAGATGGAMSAPFVRSSALVSLVGEPVTRASSMKRTPGMRPDRVGDIEDMVTDDSLGLSTRIYKELERKGDDFLEMPDDVPDKFKKWLLRQPGMKDGADLDEKFSFYAEKLGADRISQAYKTYQTQRVALGEVRKIRKEYLGDDALKDPLEGNIFAKFEDAKFVARQMDDTFGTNISGAIDAFSESKNRHSVDTAPLIIQASKLLKKANKKAKMTNQDIGKALHKGDAYKYSSDPALAKQQKAVVGEMADLYKKARGQLKEEYGMDIGQLENYFPQQMLREADLAKALRQRHQVLISKGIAGQKKMDVFEMAKGISKKERGEITRTADKGELATLRVRQENAEQSQQFLEVVKHLIGREAKNEKDIKLALTYAMDPKKQKRMKGFESSAIFSRKNVLPNFAQDWDAGRVFMNYVNGNYKAVHYFDAFQQMEMNMKMLRGMKATKSADYLEKYMKHMSGGDTGPMASMQMMLAKYREKLDRNKDEMIMGRAIAAADARGDDSLHKKIAMKGYNAVEADIQASQGVVDKAKGHWIDFKRLAPDLAAFSLSQIYPNMLGLNMKAALRNLGQTPMLTSMEIGGGMSMYGHRLNSKAFMSAFTKKHRDGQKMTAFLQSKGLAPGKFIGEGMQLPADTLKSLKGMGVSIDVANQIGDTLMGIYSFTDTYNRVLSWEMGQMLGKDLAKDIAKGGKSLSKSHALNFVNRMSSGSKQKVKHLLKNKDYDGANEEISRYLVAKTQYHYGREQQSEFGREMGRMFTMFTKWPLMVAGDIKEMAKGKQKFRALKKYLAPMAVMMAADEFMFDTEDQDPLKKYLLGQKMSNLTPGATVFNLTSVATPPVLDVVGDLSGGLMSAMEGDYEKLAKSMTGVATTFTPGLSFVHEWKRLHKAGMVKAAGLPELPYIAGGPE
jgi:hypothetical protein